MKPKLLALKGLPASGKSTRAQELVEEGWVRSNKDDIRKELYGENYKRKHEKYVIRERNRIVTEALENNKNVVVDDTNLNPIHIKDLLSIAKEYNAIFEIDDSFLQVPLGVCIERDKHRDKTVGENVIREMFHKWIKRPHTAVEYDPDLPMAVIVDIDGTLAHMVNRKPFEYHKVASDEADSAVAHLVDGVNCIGYAKVFIFTGREEVCRKETEEWLERNAIEYELMAMREKDDHRSDTDVKREMLIEHILGRYNVLFVVDDRVRVCKMWRDEFGFRVLNVGDPYYEF